MPDRNGLTGEKREQAIQPDARNERRRNARKGLVPHADIRKVPARFIEFPARQADVSGPLCCRMADPRIPSSFRLQPRQVQRAGQQQSGVHTSPDSREPAVIGKRWPKQLRNRRTIAPI